jgi:hypothetical protein
LYVGSAHDAQYDQILDEILVGPIPVGLNKFILQADAPNIDLLLQQPNISSDDILGVTVVLVTCSYKEREFVRIGYYVNNEYLGYENTGITNNTDTGTAIDDDDELDTDKSTTQPPQPQQPIDGTITPSPTTTDLQDQQHEQGEPQPPPPLPKISIYEIDFHKVQRQILADKPRVTKFPIPWNIPNTSDSTTATTTNTTNNNSNNLQQQQHQENVENNNNISNTASSYGTGSLSSPSTTSTSFMNHDKSSSVSPSSSSFQRHTMKYTNE